MFLVIFALGFYIFRKETTPDREISYRSALDFARAGKYGSALLELDKVLAYDPNYAPAYNNLGVIYWKLNRKKDALMALQKAVALDPAFPEARYNLGKLYMTLQMEEQAVRHLTEAVRLSPDYEKARRALADIYYGAASAMYGEENYNQAEHNLTRAHDHDPDRADILELWGKTEAKLGHYEEAIQLFKRALEKDGRMGLGREISDALARQGEMLYKKGELDDARACLASAMESDSENGRANYYLGLCYSGEGDISKAITHLKKGLKLDDQIVPYTEQAEYHSSIATGMKLARSYGKAAEEYRLALAIDPSIDVGKQLGECYFLLGRDASSRGRHKEASSYFGTAVDLEPGRDEYMLALAEELTALGKHEKAVSEYRALLELDPDSHENKVNLARALIRAGLYDEAISMIDRIRKMKPDLDLDDAVVAAHLGRADAAARAGEIQQAMDDYAYVTEVVPANRKAWLQLGECYEKTGDLQRAISLYRRFIDDPEIGWQCHYHLGVCLRKSGDRDSAVAIADEHKKKGDELRKAGKFAEAIREYTLAAEIVPDYELPYHVMAESYYTKKEYGKCLPYLEKCLELAPDSPVVLNDLAVVYAKVGRYDDAEALLHRAIKSKSPYYRACINLSYLYGLMQKQDESIWWGRQAGQIRKGFSQEGERGFWLR